MLYGGEGGIRTHGTLPYHWFSRPAPLPHDFFALQGIYTFYIISHNM